MYRIADKPRDARISDARFLSTVCS